MKYKTDLINAILESGVSISKIKIGLNNDKNYIELKVKNSDECEKWSYFNERYERMQYHANIKFENLLIKYDFSEYPEIREKEILNFIECLNRKFYLIKKPPLFAVSIITKITNRCNIDCKYCYDRPFREKLGHNGTLSLEKLDKLIKMASDYAETVYVMFHGGEPTLAGVEYYKKYVTDIVAKYPYADVVSHIQTNGTLLNKDWYEMSRDYGIGLSTSYNVSSEDLREVNNGNKYSLKGKDIYNVPQNIIDARELGINIGLIDVYTRQTHPNLIEAYEFYKKNGFSASFNNICLSGEALNHDFTFATAEAKRQYLKDAVKYFTYWINDKTAVPDRYAEMWITMLLTGVSAVCEYKNVCTDTYIGINSNGDIYPCDRALPDKYRMGNIEQFSSFGEMYKTEVYANYRKERASKLENYCSKCKIGLYCNGGCPMQDLDMHMDASKPNTYGCVMRKINILAAYKALQGVKNLDDCNPILKKVILTKNSILPNEIEDFLKYLGVHEHFNGIDFENKNGGFSSDAFILFKILNHPSKLAHITPFDDGLVTEGYFSDASNIINIRDNRFVNLKHALNKLGKDTLMLLLEKERDE